MNNSIVINESQVTENLELLNEALEGLGIVAMLQLAIDLDILSRPKDLEIIVGDFTGKAKTTYNIFYTHSLWGNVKILAGSGKYREFILHTNDERQKPYYILRKITDSINSSLASLAISADLILAQFSQDPNLLRALVSSGDEAILDVLKSNPNITDDIKVMIELRR
jgi:hypothetical protein